MVSELMRFIIPQLAVLIECVFYPQVFRFKFNHILKVELGFFKCIVYCHDHPCMLSTTVLSDTCKGLPSSVEWITWLVKVYIKDVIFHIAFLLLLNSHNKILYYIRTCCSCRFRCATM